MIKTPLSTMIGGAFWTPSATILGGTSKTLNQIIKSIFASNEQGFAYDPNDLTMMWQDQAKLLPVTGEGQPVWHILDKSGNNNHAFATSSASRPILRKNAVTGAYYLEFDGVDDSLQTNSINFTVTDKISMFAGQQTYIPSNLGSLIETGSNYVSPSGGFAIFAPAINSTELTAPTIGGGVSGGGGFFNLGTMLSGNLKSAITLTADLSKTLKDEQVQIRANGVRFFLSTNSTIVAGSSFANVPVYISRRAGTINPFKGRIYGLICVGKLVTENDMAVIEKELAKRTGVTLSV